MKRRLVLARALVNDPDLIFLDEPTTGLDPQARHQMWEKLRVLLRQGKTILLTTHFMDEAERLCDRLKIIDHGRTLAEGRRTRSSPSTSSPRWSRCTARAWRRGSGRTRERSRPRRAARRDRVLLPARGRARGREPARLPGAALHAPARNLEDLFLKLTGREMRE